MGCHYIHFEKVADDIDAKDSAVIRKPHSRQSNLNSQSRPYLVSAGIQGHLSMSPLMCSLVSLLSEAQFNEADTINHVC